MGSIGSEFFWTKESAVCFLSAVCTLSVYTLSVYTLTKCKPTKCCRFWHCTLTLSPTKYASQFFPKNWKNISAFRASKKKLRLRRKLLNFVFTCDVFWLRLLALPLDKRHARVVLKMIRNLRRRRNFFSDALEAGMFFRGYWRSFPYFLANLTNFLKKKCVRSVRLLTILDYVAWWSKPGKKKHDFENLNL